MLIGENNRFLGGYLVGIGKIKANGEVIYNKLEKPIHNRITSTGLDHMFLWGGTTNPNYTSSNAINGDALFTTTQTTNGYRAGILHYMAFGSGTTATTFTDTQLNNITSTYSSTKYYTTSYPQYLNGTKKNAFGSYSFRVSHQSDAVSEATTVNEIGWFGAYGSSYATKVLFARVVLPSSITLDAGEKLITTYQLDLTMSNTEISTISDFYGLKDSEGNTLHAQQRLYMPDSPGSSSSYGYPWNSSIAHPYITSDGTMSSYTSYNWGGIVTPYDMCSHSGFYNYKYYVMYSTSSTKNFPTAGNVDQGATNFFGNGGTFNVELSTYNGIDSTNKYRDRVITMGAHCPAMNGDVSGYKDIYYLRFYNMDYRFGYDDNGTWVPQALRKYANQQLQFTFRTRYSTIDTTDGTEQQSGGAESGSGNNPGFDPLDDSDF